MTTDTSAESGTAPFELLTTERVDYDVYDRLLEAGGVYQSAFGIHVVSRWSDVRDVFKQPAIYSSRANQAGIIGLSSESEALASSVLEPIAEATASLGLTVEEFMQGRITAAIDPPDHTRQRSVINRAFTPAALAPWRPWIAEIADGFTAGIDGSSIFDFVKQVAEPLPGAVGARILSVPPEHARDIKRWADMIIGNLGAARGTVEADATVAQGLAEVVRFFGPLVEAHRKTPADDLLSKLAQLEEEGALTLVEVLWLIISILVGAMETTTNLMSSMVWCLMQNRDQLELLAAEPALINNAIQETLRYRAPIHVVFRETTCDTELAGTAIPANSTVLLLVGAANRDPRQFADPSRFDVRRPNAASHHSLGHGIHFCVGAPLARLEAQSVIERLIPALLKMELGPEPPAELPSGLLQGFSKLQLMPSVPSRT